MHQDIRDTQEFARPLARSIARELSAEELAMVAGGSDVTTGTYPFYEGGADGDDVMK